MILVGNQRGGAKNLALHLLKEENEHVEVHELRGFASENLVSALNEAHAISRGTRCKQFLFSLSLNPPPNENVETAAFERAIDRVEEKLSLTGQPRAIVFHEKEGRRHAHAVWSRIDAAQMKAVALPYSKLKLQDVSRELYREHGWRMPRGLINAKERDPRNFTLSEWQQAKRTGKDPREIRTAIQDCWAASDSRPAFAVALEERGFKLAKGDKRGFVALDMQGEVYAVAKWAGVKTKEVRERLGDESTLPSVAQAKQDMAQHVSKRLGELNREQDAAHAKRLAKLEAERKALVEQQQLARTLITERQTARWQKETAERQQRFNKGLRGLIDRFSGRHRRIKAQNEAETYRAFIRDRTEKDALIFGHLEERRGLQERLVRLRQDHAGQKREIESDLSRYDAIRQEALNPRVEDFKRKRRQSAGRRQPRQRGPSRDLER